MIAGNTELREADAGLVLKDLERPSERTTPRVVVAAKIAGLHTISKCKCRRSINVVWRKRRGQGNPRRLGPGRSASVSGASKPG